MQFGTVSALLCDCVFIGIGCRVCNDQQCSVYGRNRQTVQCGAVTVLYSVTVYKFMLGVECVTVSNVVIMEGTDRECSVACFSAVLCDSVYIGIWC